MLSTLQQGGGSSGSSRQPTTTAMPPTTSTVGGGAYIPGSGTSCSAGFYSYGGGCVPCSYNPGSCGSPAVTPTTRPRTVTTSTTTPTRSCLVGYHVYVATGVAVGSRASLTCVICPSVWSAGIPFPSECFGYTRKTDTTTTTTTTTSPTSSATLPPCPSGVVRYGCVPTTTTTSQPKTTTSIVVPIDPAPSNRVNGPIWIRMKVVADNVTLSTLKAKLYLQESNTLYTWSPTSQTWSRVTNSTRLSNEAIITFRCPTISSSIPYGCTDQTRPPVTISPNYRETTGDMVVEIVQCGVASGAAGVIAGSFFGPWGTLIGLGVGIFASVGCAALHEFA